jgi:hypothetical protein
MGWSDLTWKRSSSKRRCFRSYRRHHPRIQPERIPRSLALPHCCAIAGFEDSTALRQIGLLQATKTMLESQNETDHQAWNLQLTRMLLLMMMVLLMMEHPRRRQRDGTIGRKDHHSCFLLLLLLPLLLLLLLLAYLYEVEVAFC